MAVDDPISSYGSPMPSCPGCGSKMAMSCRENYPAEPMTFTFECCRCRLVVQDARSATSPERTTPKPNERHVR
jgi:hypothetical protein